MTDATVKDHPAEWERPRQTAKALGVGISTVYNAIAKGELEAKKWGRATMISVASRRELLDRLPKAQISRKLRSA